jgi:hypothetical protein
MNLESEDSGKSILAEIVEESDPHTARAQVVEIDSDSPGYGVISATIACDITSDTWLLYLLSLLHIAVNPSYFCFPEYCSLVLSDPINIPSSSSRALRIERESPNPYKQIIISQLRSHPTPQPCRRLRDSSTPSRSLPAFVPLRSSASRPQLSLPVSQTLSENIERCSLTQTCGFTGKTFTQSASATPALLEAPAPLLARQWRRLTNNTSSDRWIAPAIALIHTGVFGYLAYKGEHDSMCCLNTPGPA